MPPFSFFFLRTLKRRQLDFVAFVSSLNFLYNNPIKFGWYSQDISAASSYRMTPPFKGLWPFDFITWKGWIYSQLEYKIYFYSILFIIWLFLIKLNCPINLIYSQKLFQHQNWFFIVNFLSLIYLLNYFNYIFWRKFRYIWK